MIFFLYRPKDVLMYVTFFTIGHSLTLMLGVLNNIAVNPYIIDAIIGFSIIYKGFDNLGGFWRRHSSFLHFSTATNTLLMSAGMMLVGFQLIGFFVTN